MSHPRWPGFDTKTGDPVVDNVNRNSNRKLWRETQKHLKFTARSRKRKKHITRAEGGNYIKLLVATAYQLSRRQHPGV